jgi:hypothetical protein
MLVGIQEGQLRDEAAVARQLEERLGRKGKACDRVVGAVTPFLHALAKGEIAAPEVLGVRTDVPATVG